MSFIDRLLCALGFHAYTAWKNKGSVDIYSPDGSDYPVRTELIQARVCTKCGYIKARRQVL